MIEAKRRLDMAERDRLWRPLARGDHDGRYKQSGAAIGAAVLNHMRETGRPDSVRSSKKFE